MKNETARRANGHPKTADCLKCRLCLSAKLKKKLVKEPRAKLIAMAAIYEDYGKRLRAFAACRSRRRAQVA